MFGVSESTLISSKFNPGDKSLFLKLQGSDLPRSWNTDPALSSRSKSILFTSLAKKSMYFTVSRRTPCLESFLSGGWVGKSLRSSWNAALTLYCLQRSRPFVKTLRLCGWCSQENSAPPLWCDADGPAKNAGTVPKVNSSGSLAWLWDAVVVNTAGKLWLPCACLDITTKAQ